MAYRPKDTHERITHRLKIARGHLDKVIKIYDDKLDGIIDEATYFKKRKEYLDERASLETQIKQHRVADDIYKDFGCLVLDVAERAGQIYGVRKAEEKRYLSNFVFSNLSLRDKNIQFSFRLIFEAIKKYQKDKNGLPSLDSNQNKRIQSPLSYH